MKKPPSPRTKFLMIRVTDKERKEFDKAAELADRLSVSDWARRLMTAEAKRLRGEG